MNKIQFKIASIRRRSGENTGFTLVEILVVIAIILILVGLLMPTLSRVRETAKNVKCINNLRQIYMATSLYATDNNGFAPHYPKMAEKREYFVQRSHNPSDPSYRDYYPVNKWFAEYFPSGGNGLMNPIGYCPLGGVIGEIGLMGKGDIYNSSYGMNPDLVEDWWLTNEWKDRGLVPLSQIRKPSRVSLWMDANKQKVYEKGASLTGRHFSKSKVSATEPGPVLGSYSVYKYNGYVNVVFVDGHLSRFKSPEQDPQWSCSFWKSEKNGGLCSLGQCGACDNDL